MKTRRSHRDLINHLKNRIRSCFSGEAGRLLRVTEFLPPAPLRLRIQYFIIPAIIAWIPSGCADQQSTVDEKTPDSPVESSRAAAMVSDPQQQTPDHPDKETTRSEDPERPIATFLDTSLSTDEFYVILNYDMIFSEIQSRDQFDRKNFAYETTSNALWNKVCQVEAESHGADIDPQFMAYLKWHRTQFFTSLGSKVILPTLPPAEPVDPTPPDENEMREHFDLWQKQFVRLEPIWAHYIVLNKKGDDPAGNEAQRLRAGKALTRIRSGEDFVDVKMEMTDAEKPTRDPWMLERSNDRLNALRRVLEIMQPGELSDVIDRPQAYYIFYVLPGQEWNDLSSYEKMQANPQMTQKLADFILNLRPKINPMVSFVDEQLFTEPGYEEYDPTALDDYQVPPPETVLVGLDDLSWTMQELADIWEFWDPTRTTPLEKDDVIESIRDMRHQFLITAMIDRGEIEVEKKWFQIWPVLERRNYKRWLQTNLDDFLLRQSLDLPEEGHLVEEDAKFLAREIVQRLSEDFSEHAIIKHNYEEIDWSRVKFYVKPPDRFAKPDFRPPIPDTDTGQYQPAGNPPT